MEDVVRPATEAELVEAVEGSAAPFEIVGTGTKRGLGRPVAAGRTLDLSRFSAVTAYEPEELILECGPGALLRDIETLLGARGQRLAFEPPDWSRLLGAAHSGTIGGCLLCNLSGPRRIASGALRDHVLGIAGVSGNGQRFKAGARVVKNVTGYDLPKLIAGSYGTLAALTSVILKVLPRPETEETVLVTDVDDTEAVRLMSLAMQSSCEVTGAAFVPGQAVHLRLEGIAPSVAYRRDRLSAVLGQPIQVMAARSSAAAWASIRDATAFTADAARPVWRISVPPSEAPGLVARLKDITEPHYYLDWAGGLVWVELPPSEDAGAAAVRSVLAAGHATLVRASAAVRAGVAVFQPQPEPLAALSRRVKAAFDPGHIFNPGRMYRDA